MISPEQMLAKAIEIAAVAHSDQFDKQGQPYILHPITVMMKFLDDPELAAIAILHDVIEDTQWTIKDLQNWEMSSRIIAGVTHLTHAKGITYDDYITTICQSLDTIKVKKADIEHNTLVTRSKGCTQKDFDRNIKYFLAYQKLCKAEQKLK